MPFSIIPKLLEDFINIIIKIWIKPTCASRIVACPSHPMICMLLLWQPGATLVIDRIHRGVIGVALPSLTSQQPAIINIDRAIGSLQGFFQQFWGKGPCAKLGKMFDLTSKLGENYSIEHKKGCIIYPQNLVILDCIMPSIPHKHKCLSIILIWFIVSHK